MAENELNARQKGDIYWKKLKRYIASKESHGDTGKGDKDVILAKEIFSKMKEAGKEEITEKKIGITGDEFKVMPPTATANEIFGDGIIRVCRYMNYFSGLSETAGGASGTDRIFYENLPELVSAMENALNTFFTTAGIDAKSGEAVSPETRREAEKNRKDVYDRYEKTVKGFRRKVSLNIIDSLDIGVEGAGADESALNEECDNVFKEIEALDPGMYDFNRPDMDNLKEEYKKGLEQDAFFSEKLSLIEKKVEEKASEDEENEWISLKEAFDEYRFFANEEQKKTAFERGCCLIYAKFILTDDMVDPLAADYIFEHYGERANTYPMDKEICSLPDFVNIDYDAGFDIPEIKSDEDMEKASAELSAYRKTHPGQFESQTLSSLFFGTGELPILEKKARALRNAISGKVGHGFANKIMMPENDGLRRMWIEADAFASVAGQILDYAVLNRRKTIKDLLPTISDETFEMSYQRQEKISSLTLANAAERGDS